MYFLNNYYLYIEILFIWGIIGLFPLYYKNINDYFICFASYCLLLISCFTTCLCMNSQILQGPVNVMYLISIASGFASYISSGYHFEFITIVNMVRIHYYYFIILLFCIKKCHNLIIYFFDDSVENNVSEVKSPPQKIKKETVENEVSVSINSCIICYTNDYKQINLLCNHTLCEKCIYELRKNQNDKCPFCRADLIES